MARETIPPALVVAIGQRDRWICRYSGRRLYFAGLLRLRAHDDPVGYPWHPNRWTVPHVHPDVLDQISVEHLEPVSRGGSNDPANLIAAAWMLNLERGARSHAEAGLVVLPIGTDSGWDGGVRAFVEAYARRPDLRRLGWARG